MSGVRGGPRASPRGGRLLPLALALHTALVAVALRPRAAAAQDQHRAILREKFEERLREAVRDFDGVAGVQVVDLTTGERIGVGDDLVFPQGSAIKIPILLELFRRAEEEPGLLGRRVRLERTDVVGGSGILQHFGSRGSELTLEDLAVLMITLSDNTATNLLIDVVEMGPVNALMASLDAPATLLQRRMIDPEASARGEENLSTPADAARLMERIARCEVPMSEAACFRIQEILELPKSGPLRAPIPSSVPVAFKPGGIEGVATAWALVSLPDRPYVLTVMTNYGRDGDETVRRVSEAAWEYFYRLARSTDHGARVPLDVIRRRRSGGI